MKESKFISFIKRRSRFDYVLLCGFLIILAGLIIVIMSFKNKPMVPEKETKSQTQAETESEAKEEATTEPADPYAGMVISPLTGMYVEKEIASVRPVAVMLNNIEQAVPQAGIESADIVYECPVEGGITRLMGIFQDFEDLDKIGSVRSCRLYYAQIAMEYDAVYIHIGQSKYALDFLDSGLIDHLNAETYDGIAYRTSDRQSPHNAYVSGQGILYGEEILDISETADSSCPLSFLPFGEQREETGDTAVYVEPGFSYNDPYFTYDEEEKVYDRFQFGAAQTDELTGRQLSYKNLIIQYVGGYYQEDGYTWDLDMTGSGYGKYITDGKMIDITWYRSSVYDKTVYYDENGEELLLNPGKTWITVMQDSLADSLIVY